VDLLTVNAPYVPSAELELLPREARLYEPRTALDGGVDGLDVLRRAIAEAPAWLAPDGCLLTEATEAQAPAVVKAAARAGVAAVVVADD
jgi:release factor glutamine methyltransferase